MKTIYINQIEQAEKLGAEFIGSTTIWDVHHCSIKSKRSSSFRFASYHIKKGVKAVVALIGAKGRSAHSASEVLLYDVADMNDEAIADLMLLSNHYQSAIYENRDNEDILRPTRNAAGNILL